MKMPKAPGWLKSSMQKVLRSDGLSNNEILAGFITGNGWLFSQPKTGTNYISSALAFYNAEVLGVENYSFDDRYRLGMVHGGQIIRSAEEMANALSFQRLSTSPMIVRWHDDVPAARPDILICTTRDILDQACSLWHYKYRPFGCSVDSAIPEMVGQFCLRNRAQARAAERTKREAIAVTYENLLSNAQGVLCKVIKAAWGSVDQESLNEALRRSSKEEFGKWERSRGAPAIDKKLRKYETSFIRSGEVGEGYQFFTREQSERIVDLAKAYGVDRSGSIW